jgi:NADH-quinone oxidoreductase subunit G
MITVFIDNKPYTVAAEGRNMLDVCLSLGFNLPYFCWHPAMHSVGACRQCAVKLFKDEKDTRGRIVMSCMTPAAEGIRVSIDDPEAVEFRARVVEWLMVNHPHDCPVCDEGGECHLQDMTVMTGHVYRRFRFRKRTHRNQDLGPFINHEMNRCIQCYRCTRFYNDYAGGTDFGVFAWHNHVYFGRHADGALENEFSGNLVEVCPTGVFTDKTLGKHYTRKWDLQTAPSICVHCGLGCNTIPGERYGKLRRIRGRYNGDVNGYFLCDRGRYGYEFVNSDKRIRQVLIGERPSELRPANEGAALSSVGRLVQDKKAIGIGSPRASLETNFALQTLVGPDRFYHGVSENEYRLVRLMLDILQKGPVRTWPIQETQKADAVFILGEDVWNSAPMLVLALRQAGFTVPKEAAQKLNIQAWDDAAIRRVAQGDRSPFFIATPGVTNLDRGAATTYRAAPEDIARLGFAVARAIDVSAPAVVDLPDEVQSLALQIAEALKVAKHPLIVSGPGLGCASMIQAAANVACALKATGHEPGLTFTVPECNSFGLGLLPGAGSLSAALQAVQNGSADTVVIVENDLYRQMSDPEATELLTKAKNVIVLDHLANATVEKATVVFPAATFAEAAGTLVNNEGRGQRFFQVFVPKDAIRESWRWLGDVSVAAGQSPVNPWLSLDDLLSAIARTIPALKDIMEIAPEAGFRMVGQRIPRQPHRYSGRTAITANVEVNEPKPPEDLDSPLAFSMEGYQEQPPSALISRFRAPGWNSPQAICKFQTEVNGPLRGGNPGRRLIEPAAVTSLSYFTDIPPAFRPRSSEWLVLPAYHVFGSEPLSMHTAGVAQRAPNPYVALNPRDGGRLGGNDKAPMRLTINEQVFRVILRIQPGLPDGVALVPAGLPGLPGISWPAWGKIALDEQGGVIGNV